MDKVRVRPKNVKGLVSPSVPRLPQDSVGLATEEIPDTIHRVTEGAKYRVPLKHRLTGARIDQSSRVNLTGLRPTRGRRRR